MKLVSFRIQKYRNIQDTGEVTLDDDLTCIVGKNQSGKTALLRALHKFNPHKDDPYNISREWPRGERRKRNENQVVSEVKFRLDEDERTVLAELTDGQMITDIVVVTKDYAGNYEVSFPDQLDLFPDQIHPNEVDEICVAIDLPTEPVGDEFRTVAVQCATEVRTLASEGRFSELNSVHADHDTQLRAALTPGAPPPEPHNQNENSFITAYAANLQSVRAKLEAAPTMQYQAHDYIVTNLPTFIYMDDYREFKGTALLDQVLSRQAAKKQLTDEDETFLMMLTLSGLNLEDLVDVGRSDDIDLLHERKLDLEDGERTLTNDVAARWTPNPYKVRYLADGQKFYIEIEEVEKDIGMIPLEEQSKGFRWFFSFDLRFMHESDGTFEGCVLLLDEPGLYLHPGAQQDLLDRLDAYAKKNTLIYTTHLPFLVDLREPRRIRVIGQTENGAGISEDLGSSQAEEKLTLQAALGMKMNQHFLVAPKNLVVEGAHDFWLITELSNVFERSGLPPVPDDVMITGTWGASGVVTVATFMIGQELDVLAFFDSDNEGKTQEARLRTQWITRYKNTTAKTLLLGAVCGISGDATIEDLFPKDYYEAKLRESHMDKLEEIRLKPKEVKMTGKDRIELRAKAACETAGIIFNKGSVAKHIRRDLVHMSNVSELPTGTKEKVEKLFEAIRKHFA